MWDLSIQLLNRFSNTGTVIFPCRLCVVRTASLYYITSRVSILISRKYYYTIFYYVRHNTFKVCIHIQMCLYSWRYRMNTVIHACTTRKCVVYSIFDIMYSIHSARFTRMYGLTGVTRALQ